MMCSNRQHIRCITVCIVYSVFLSCILCGGKDQGPVLLLAYQKPAPVGVHELRVSSRWCISYNGGATHVECNLCTVCRSDARQDNKAPGSWLLHVWMLA